MPNTDTICLIGGDEKIGGYVRRRLTEEGAFERKRKEDQHQYGYGKNQLRRVDMINPITQSARPAGPNRGCKKKDFQVRGRLNPSAECLMGSSLSRIIRGATLTKESSRVSKAAESSESLNDPRRKKTCSAQLT